MIKKQYKYNRIIVIVNDSLGIGNDKRAEEFGDKGANTFKHISELHKLIIPTWKKLGIGLVAEIKDYRKQKTLGYATSINSLSNAKDTLAGHWEMMGIKTTNPFPVFTNTGFPKDLLEQLSKKCDNREIIGNKAASGTEILKELASQEKENKLIVYTSSDSVLQICGDENDMGLDNLYRYCEEARKICSSKPEWNVGRIIARPYVVENNNYTRTSNRHDWAVSPTHKTILNSLIEKDIKVIGFGKIKDIFNGSGISESFHTDGNNDGMDQLINFVHKGGDNQFIFVNLVDFDSKYGHRRDPLGYANAINDFDIKLTKLLNVLKDDDLLMITADHGNDPTFPGSDHTRERVPLTIYSNSLSGSGKIEDKSGFGTIGNIIARNFEVELTKYGEDIFDKIK